MPHGRSGDSPLGRSDPRVRDQPMGRDPNRYPEDDMMMDAPFAQQPGRQAPGRTGPYGEDVGYGQGPPGHAGHPGHSGHAGHPGNPQYGRDTRGPYVDDYPQQGGYPANQRFPPGRQDIDMRDGNYQRPAQGYNMNGMPPQEYGRPPDAYNAGPPNVPYGAPQHPNRGMDPAYAGPQFGAPPNQPRNDRDTRFPSVQSGNFGQDMRNQDMRDPRDPRYAYPSPAQSTVDPRDNVTNPSQHKYACLAAITAQANFHQHIWTRRSTTRQPSSL